MEMQDISGLPAGTAGQKAKLFAPLFRVTPLSKYLALALFVLLPFVGGVVGYWYALDEPIVIETTPVGMLHGDVDESLVYSYSKNDDIKVFNRTQTQRIGLNISPLSHKYLYFDIWLDLAKNQQVDFIDHINFNVDKGIVFSDDDPLLGIHTLNPGHSTEDAIYELRLKQFNEQGLLEKDVKKLISDYLSLHKLEGTDPIFKEVCSIYSWQSHGNIFYKLIPFDSEVGTDLMSLCGYTKFVAIDNLLIENYVPGPHRAGPMVGEDIVLTEE